MSLSPAAFEHLTARTADAVYVAARDALIPAAEAEANEKAGPPPEPPELEGSLPWAHWNRTWNEAFHAAMTRLARGLR